MKHETRPVEIWGGAECTYNRVGDIYYDQLARSGHCGRLEDLDKFYSLGIRTLRVGLVWERHIEDPSWSWADASLERMRALGIRPIFGLMHHGSGPRHMSLLDPQFPERLAEYAGQAAERFPWIDAYTPINEPHTTARFTGLYGIWHPHQRGADTYLRALIREVKATVLSMRAIRRTRPDAELIQTEDVGRIWSTEELSAERQSLEERRWITFDLLCGAVGRQHPLFEYFLAHGILEEEVLWFRDNPCPPNVIGINYYVTSDRFLDHRVEHYPASLCSSEGPYVDVDAVRVRPEGIAGFESLLRETWERYRIPVAITEVHLGDSAAEQIRWIAEAWEGAQLARAAGVDCRAITLWALLGSFHWNVLVTSENGRYEPGVFDVSGGVPAPTALANVVRQMTSNRKLFHPALAHPGWWKTEERIAYAVPEAGDPVEKDRVQREDMVEQT